MRRTTIAMLALATVAVSGCGGGSTFANKPRPPVTVNLSVYIDNQRVSVSPSSVGAGPVEFIVTNQASRAESLVILPAGASSSSSQPLADTGPINPQATAQVTVNFSSPGDYRVETGALGSEAARATPSAVQPAFLRIGPPRPSASNQLLQP